MGAGRWQDAGLVGVRGVWGGGNEELEKQTSAPGLEEPNGTS